MIQKDIFLNSEGDAWFARNHDVISKRHFSEDSIVQNINDINTMVSLEDNAGGGGHILEVGCGEGRRLQWLEENINCQCYGIDPSTLAVQEACEKGVSATVGTADQLPFEKNSFDIVIFGFCLYLCDRIDLFNIAKEADRVLKPEAWLIIKDFFAETPSKNDYQHKTGVSTFKMDYRTLFTWHPDYTCFKHSISHHGIDKFTDETQEWVGESVIRKKSLYA